LGLIKTAIDQAASAADKFEAADGDSIFGDEATFLTADSQLAHVSDALIKAQNLIDGATMGGDTEPESAQFWLNDEDTEMVQATLQTAQTEIQRAQIHITEWQGILNGAVSEAQGFAQEVQARAAFTGAKGQAIQAIIAGASGYLQAAQGYSGEIQSKIGIAQGYIAEANIRIQRDAQKYQWYQGQQVKLQQDYDKGMQILISANVPKQSQKLGDIAIPK